MGGVFPPGGEFLNIHLMALGCILFPTWVSEKMGTPLYFGVWNCLEPLSNEEAAHQYQLLKDLGSERRFDDKVYAFYSRLIGLYPEVETLSEDELDDSPWACSMEVSDSHVVMAIVPEK